MSREGLREILNQYGKSNFSLSGNGSYTIEQAIVNILTWFKEEVVPKKQEYLEERGHVLPDIDVIMENKFRAKYNEVITDILAKLEKK